MEPVTLAHPGKLRIGYFREGLERAGMDPEVVAHLQGHIERLRAEGHTVEPVDVPLLDHQVPTYYILATAEASRPRAASRFNNADNPVSSCGRRLSLHALKLLPCVSQPPQTVISL